MAWYMSWIAYNVRNEHILWIYCTNRIHNSVSPAMLAGGKTAHFFMTTPRFLAVKNAETVMLSRVMERSLRGKHLVGIWRD